MTDQTLSLAPPGPCSFEPQDRAAMPAWAGVFGTILTAMIVSAAIYQARDFDLAQISGLVPTSPVFWSLFVISYLLGPAADWLIFRRLWGVGADALGALIRKLLYNELLLNYLGEVYFYGWARRNLRFATAPFGAVKDVALLSAVAGNVATLFFLCLTFPFLRLLPIHDHATALGWSLAFAVGTSLAVMLLRRSLFSLSREELKSVLSVHLIRILTATFLSAVLWHLVLPDVALGWWLILSTARLLVFRLPFVPNKEVAFAGLAVLVLGGDVEISALMALMAVLVLSAHVLVGTGFVVADLLSKGSRNDLAAR
ncbi:hypothetical protein ABS767_06680 [Sphingomonas sp. ST-64]|uniref:Flippase-like domain-containing protein n=1 Tax=Sphingomonas plantiphila TaxID=3163295 RepID=A0ABW8YMG5_9SPHN